MKKLLLLFFLSVCLLSTRAQDFVGGDISYRHISGNDYQFTFSAYTTQPRTYIVIYWGPTSPDSIPVSLPVMIGDIYKYSFIKNHVFPGSGLYQILVSGDYLVDPIENLADAGTKRLMAWADLVINPNFPPNNSPVLLSPPDFHESCCDPIIYNPAAFDSDGDSISYSLWSYDLSYSFMGAQMDSSTGDLFFTPPKTGRYLFTITISDWRKEGASSTKIGMTWRMMVLNVGSTSGINETGRKEPDVYPNPASDKITISGVIASGAKQSPTVKIYNIMGEEVYVSEIRNNGIASPLAQAGPSFAMTVDCREWAKGVYFVQVSDREKVYRNKFIKQ